MPFFDAPPMPAKNDSGTLITSAHGHDTTRNMSARDIHSAMLPTNIGGMSASARAENTTTGV